MDRGAEQGHACSHQHPPILHGVLPMQLFFMTSLAKSMHMPAHTYPLFLHGVLPMYLFLLLACGPRCGARPCLLTPTPVHSTWGSPHAVLFFVWTAARSKAMPARVPAHSAWGSPHAARNAVALACGRHPMRSFSYLPMQCFFCMDRGTEQSHACSRTRPFYVGFSPRSS